MSDYMVRASASGGFVRAFAVTSKDTLEEARKAHNTSPVASAALGRMLSAAAMMGSMMKGEEDLLTLKIEGTGPLKGILVTADHAGGVKGYPFEPVVLIPANAKGKLDVAEAIGVGMLSVISDTGMKEPYVGQVELISGEIAEDITYYYATSEQTPSSVALGVLMNPDNTVRAAGGFIIQLMPGCPEEVIDVLEKKIGTLPPVTTLLAEGKTPENILDMILGEITLDIHDRMDVGFRCNCSKSRVEKVLLSVGEKELLDMIESNEPIEVKCHFCNKGYVFEVDEIEKLLESGK